MELKIMASSSSSSLTSFLSKPPKTSSIFPNNITPSHLSPFSSFTLFPKLNPPYQTKLQYFSTRIRASSGTAASPNPKAEKKKEQRVQRVHSIEDFDNALRAANDRLVVVEFAQKNSEQSSQIYPFMVELSRTCNDVEFILVMGDESEATKALCTREKIEQVPHFSFYKSMVKIHEEEAIIGPDQLVGDVLYYGDSHSAVVQLHSREDVERLINEHRGDGKLIVLDVGLKHCGPCVKVYPTVVKLSRQMETVVFARMNGDENESCMEFLRDMKVVEVPTFVFLRDGEICGRYVGSGKGELIGEILRYQGVRVTY